jgi:selenocysteine lyase/cysteine desulfurase
LLVQEIRILDLFSDDGHDHSKEQRTCTTQVIIINPEPQDAQPPFIYLNNAATTWPKPHEVLEEVTKSLRRPLYEPGRTTGNGSMDYPSAAHEALAPFFHAGPPEHFIFTQNATDSLNLLMCACIKKERTDEKFREVCESDTIILRSGG